MVVDDPSVMTEPVLDRTAARPGSATTLIDPLVVLMRTTAAFTGAGNDMIRP